MTRSPALAGTTVMHQLPEIVPASDCWALHDAFRICLPRRFKTKYTEWYRRIRQSQLRTAASLLVSELLSH